MRSSRQAVLDRLTPETYGTHWMLCFSGMASQNSGTQSFLATHPRHLLTGQHYTQLPTEGLWFGGLGYGMRCDTEALPRGKPPTISLPDLHLFQPAKVESWQHDEDETISAEASTVSVNTLHSNMSKQAYLARVEATLEHIAAGNVYQANITRKFYGEFDQAPDPVALFKRLCAISPSPYAALMRWENVWVLSSSPEGFVQGDAAGRLVVRPIKGTGSKDNAALEESAKDRAENLMIVDLMRNDLARICDPESVRVEALCEIHEFATLRQMISTISGQRRNGCGFSEILPALFPPGSMTGAPKIAAMRWCDAQEGMERGLYSGALGWLNADDLSCDLSVVIRTLLLQGNRFEFQVGGGIVADSDPEAEWRESLLKAQAICRLLGLPESRLTQL
ncbi:MAG: hypothetical protein CMM93_06470 [Rickettsiales bacterium]|nr:hypothetical protein [Rickettsiales bacterium]